MKTKPISQEKLLKMISREIEFERNGGGQFVSKSKAFKNKKKYNRKDEKARFNKHLETCFLFCLHNIY
jgi:hypothetical protein